MANEKYSKLNIEMSTFAKQTTCCASSIIKCWSTAYRKFLVCGCHCFRLVRLSFAVTQSLSLLFLQHFSAIIVGLRVDQPQMIITLIQLFWSTGANPIRGHSFESYMTSMSLIAIDMTAMQMLPSTAKTFDHFRPFSGNPDARVLPFMVEQEQILEFCCSSRSTILTHANIRQAWQTSYAPYSTLLATIISIGCILLACIVHSQEVQRSASPNALCEIL